MSLRYLLLSLFFFSPFSTPFLFSETTPYLKALNWIHQAELLEEKDGLGNKKAVVLYKKAYKTLNKIVKADAKPSYIEALVKISLPLRKNPKAPPFDSLMKAIKIEGNENSLANIEEYLGLYEWLYQSNLASASTHFKKALGYNPKKIHAAFHAGNVALQRGQTKKAKDYFHLLLGREDVDQYPEMAFKSRRTLASIYLGEDETVKTKDLFEAILQSPYASQQEGDVLKQWLMAHEAESLNFSRALHWVGEIDFPSAVIKEQEKVFGFLADPQADITYEATTPQGELFLSAVRYYQQGKILESAGMFMQLIEENSWELKALYGLYLITLEEKSHHREHVYFMTKLLTLLYSDKMFAQGLRLIKRSRDAQVSLPSENIAFEGILASESGLNELAKEKFLFYIEKKDARTTILTRILNYFEKQGDYAAMEQTAQALLQRNNQEPLYYKILGKTYEKLNKNAQALSIYQKGLEFDPENKTLLEILGLLYFKLGRSDEMIETYTKLIRLYPLTVNFYNFLGYFYADQNQNLDEADFLLEKGLALSPHNPAILDSLAWLRFRQKRYTQALKVAKQAISGMEKAGEVDGVLYFHTGEIYLSLGDLEKAGLYFKKTLAVKVSEETVKEKVKTRLEELKKR